MDPTTNSNLDVRASDADRERVVALLRRHAADGRLTLDELGDRIGEAYAARTTGDLVPVLRELPAPMPEPPRATVARPRRTWHPATPLALVVAVVVLTGWAVTAAVWFPWPLLFLGCAFKARARHHATAARVDTRGSA
ncbi:MAG: DUF1707 SHOCT-like domain-containing protein [Egibacteraceae bacterium]